MHKDDDVVIVSDVDSTVNFLDNRLPARFWSKCIPEPNTGCWMWLAGTNPDSGYAKFFVGDGRRRQSAGHRVAYEALVAPIPEGLVLDHLCRNHWCVNPRHLEAVTQGENVLRGLKGLLRTHCLRGHEVNAQNTRFWIRRGFNVRDCMECRRIRARAAHRRKREREREIQFSLDAKAAS